MNRTDDSDAARFDALFRAAAPRVHAYVRRHVAPDLVEEVVAETFLVAWRRRDVLPTDEPVPWLLVTARHTVANAVRRAARQTPVADLLDDVAAPLPAVDGAVVDRATALAALRTLTDKEREAVLLVAWDGLEPRAAARVAGCSVRAFTVRLHRARQRLAREMTRELADPPSPARAADPLPRPAVLAEETR